MNSRDNYFDKLIKYIKKVYHIDNQINHVTDKRVNPTYKTPQIISLVLTGFLLRVRSFNQLNNMIKADDFYNLFSNKGKLPKIDAIRQSLKSVDLISSGTSTSKYCSCISSKSRRQKVKAPPFPQVENYKCPSCT